MLSLAAFVSAAFVSAAARPAVNAARRFSPRSKLATALLLACGVLAAGSNAADAQYTCATLSPATAVSAAQAGAYFSFHAGDVINVTTSAVFTITNADTNTNYGFIPSGTETFTLPVASLHYSVRYNNPVPSALSCVSAQVYTVTTAADTGGYPNNCTVNSTSDANCGLRDALEAVAANSAVNSTNPGLIVFSPSLAGPNLTTPFTISFPTYYTLQVHPNTTIQGLTTPTGKTNLVTLSGSNNNLVLYVNSGGPVTLNNLTIANGKCQFGDAAITNRGNLTLNYVSITGNTCNSYQFTTAVAGINNTGTVNLNNSLIANNTNPSAYGAPTAIMNQGTFNITNSTITGNQQTGNAGIITSLSGSMNFTNVTISGNSYAGPATLALNVNGTYSFTNTVLGGNSGTGATSGGDCQGTACPVNAASGNVIYAGNVGLAPLANYGGYTMTTPALPGGLSSCTGTTGGPATDQRGVPRPTVYAGANCYDSGATQGLYTLAFTQQPAAFYKAGQSIGAAASPAVSVLDNGFVLAVTGGTFAYTDAGGNLAGGSTPTVSAGVATLPSAFFLNPGSADTLTATYTTSINGGPVTLTTPISNSFKVVPPVDHFTITPLSSQNAGDTSGVAITAYSDAAGQNVAYGYNGPATFTTTDPNAVFNPAPPTFMGGYASFTIGFRTVGNQTITVADASGTPTVTSSPIAVSAGAASKFLAATGSGQSATIGQAFTNALQVQAVDAYNNSVGGAIVQFNRPSSGPSVTLSSNTCTTSTAANATTANPLGFCSVTATANGLSATATPYTVNAVTGQCCNPVIFTSFTLTNNRASVGLTVSVTPTTAVYGQTLTLKATYGPLSIAGVYPTGAVTFSNNGSNVGSAVTPTAGIATTTTILQYTGIQNYKAQSAGDANFLGASPSATASVPTTPATVTYTGPASIPQVIPGNSASIPVTIAGPYTGAGISPPTGTMYYQLVNNANGSVPYQNNVPLTNGAATATTPTSLAPGVYTLQVFLQPGDTNYQQVGGYTNVLTFQVGQLQPVVTFPTPAAITYGTALGSAFSATAAYNGTTVPGTITYTATPSGGSASAVTSSSVLNAGTYTLTANFTPTDTTTYKNATNTASITVNQAAQTITFAPASPVTLSTTPIQLTATSTGSGSPITFAITSGGAYGSLSGTNNSILTLTGAGTIVITASQAASTNYTAATAVPATIVVGKATAAGSLTSSSNAIFNGNSVTFTATLASAAALPTGSVTFFDNGTAIGAAVPLVNGVATLTTSTLSTATHTVTATYSGDANFGTLNLPSVSVVVSDVTIVSTIPDIVVSRGGSGSTSVQITPSGSTTFPQAVNFTVTGLTGGITATVTPASLAAGSASTLVTVTVQVPAGFAELRRIHTAERIAPIAFALLLLPFARRMRKSGRRMGTLLMLAIFATCALTATTGCGNTATEGQSAQLNVTSGTFTRSIPINVFIQ